MRSGYIQNKIYGILKPEIRLYQEEFVGLEKQTMNYVKEQQEKTLRHLIAHAYNTTPYYHQLYDQCGLNESIINNNYNLSELPILRKNELVTHSKNLLSDSVEKREIMSGHTGGSTGMPVTYYFDKITAYKMMAVLRVFYSWSGWKPGEKILHLWGAKQDLSKSGAIKQIASEWLTREKRLPAYEIDEQIMENWLKDLEKYKPTLIQGYASILSMFAGYLKSIGRQLHGIKGVYSTAEVLYPSQRNIIEQVFGCKVHDQYGCREIPGIACECSHGNMHIHTGMAYVETVGDDDNSDGKNLIVTSLANWSMPLIRYEVGDLGLLKDGSCSCGLPFPLLKMGLCRTNDLVRTTSGKTIYPSYFVHLLDEFTEIPEYQFRQEQPGKVVLYIKEQENISLQLSKLQNIVFKVNSEFANELELEIEPVKNIEKTRAGKYRFVVSNIK